MQRVLSDMLAEWVLPFREMAEEKAMKSVAIFTAGLILGGASMWLTVRGNNRYFLAERSVFDTRTGVQYFVGKFGEDEGFVVALDLPGSKKTRMEMQETTWDPDKFGLPEAIGDALRRTP